MPYNESRLQTLVSQLTSLSKETEWVEFKENNDNPHEIGEYISALSNSAALHGKQAAYIVWGVKSTKHEIVGTTFKPRHQKIGNEELENWLTVKLVPRVHFTIHEFSYDEKPIVLFEVSPALHTPVRFNEVEYIRVGSYKKKLKDYPEKERELWACFSQSSFEKGISYRNVSSDQVLDLIDYPAYFELTGQKLPDNKQGIMSRLESEDIIINAGTNVYDITNLGGILFAKDLQKFKQLARKTIRVIIYRGKDRTETVREQQGTKGYAIGFKGLIAYINDQLPQNEQIEQALRKEVRMYPEIAIRELVANAIIHQDFSLTGTGPMVEIFSDRIEITNPGVPLIDTLRFIDEPPRSRNEALTAFMRRINICEERGSGIDKVIFQVEFYQLPAPEFIVTADHTKSVLFAHLELKNMEQRDRIRACYHHACLKYVSNDVMTNASLRERFNIEESNYPMASRIISDTIDAGLIKKHDPQSTSRKHAKYLPFWA